MGVVWVVDGDRERGCSAKDRDQGSRSGTKCAHSATASHTPCTKCRKREVVDRSVLNGRERHVGVVWIVDGDSS